MSDPSPHPPIPPWLAPAVVVMLGLQLALTWMHGSLLHRQHEDLVALREDVQILTETVEEGFWAEGDGELEENFLPIQRDSRRLRLQRVRLIQDSPADEDPAQKELEASRESAKKAVTDAREVQSKLSITENARRAEEKAQMEAAGSRWQLWLMVALGAGLVALVMRLWLRRRD